MGVPVWVGRGEMSRFVVGKGFVALVLSIVSQNHPDFGCSEC